MRLEMRKTTKRIRKNKRKTLRGGVSVNEKNAICKFSLEGFSDELVNGTMYYLKLNDTLYVPCKYIDGKLKNADYMSRDHDKDIGNYNKNDVYKFYPGEINLKSSLFESMRYPFKWGAPRQQNNERTPYYSRNRIVNSQSS